MMQMIRMDTDKRGNSVNGIYFKPWLLAQQPKPVISSSAIDNSNLIFDNTNFF